MEFAWHHITIVGVVSLVLAFIFSFFFRTAWGHWHTGRGRRYKRFTAEERKDLYQLYSEKKRKKEN